MSGQRQTFEEKRRAVRAGQLATGTIACPSCDAPVAIGDRPLSLTDRLACPVCATSGPVRDVLSLAVPTRPTRVVIRVSGIAV